jgi:hypothetical protein
MQVREAVPEWNVMTLQQHMYKMQIKKWKRKLSSNLVQELAEQVVKSSYSCCCGHFLFERTSITHRSSTEQRAFSNTVTLTHAYKKTDFTTQLSYADVKSGHSKLLGFWTLSIVRYSKQLDDSETGSVSVLRWGAQDTWLGLDISKGPNWVGVFLLTWGRKQIQFPKRRVFYFLEYRKTWKSKNPSNSECYTEPFRIYWSFKFSTSSWFFL